MANVNTDEWQVEMDSMLKIIEDQSAASLRKISQLFDALNRTFTDDFRQYFFKMSMQRLDISYTKVELEQWNKIQARNNEIQLNSDRDGQALNNGPASPMVVSLPENDPLAAVVKIEESIEVEDSNDENEEDNVIQIDDDDDAPNGNEVQDDANVTDSSKKKDSNITAKFKLGEVVIPLERCDKDQAKDMQGAQKRVRDTKKAKPTPKTIRKSPRN